MCGICGYIALAPRHFDSAPIRAMTAALAHRGPDGEGFHTEPARGAALGHRRLKVIDLSERGAQPMSDETGRRWIVYNGEIYNYRELRAELERDGWRFRSQTDTEVVLLASLAYGDAFIDKLNGDFAFALWDRDTNTLSLYRDRVGVKPLYYTLQNGLFAFASEIKALLKHPDLKTAPNEARFKAFLSNLYVCGKETLFTDIYELQPGEKLTFRNGEIRTKSYFDWRYLPDVRALPEPEQEERFVELFDDAVQARLISDVPLGVYLSGGVDSSYLTARLAAHRPKAIHTYTLGFDVGDYNEFKYSQAVADRFAARHTAFTVSAREFFDVVERVVWHYDEPMPHLVAVPQYYLAERAKPHITVALSGTGGDESFAGYTHYLAAQRLLEKSLDLSSADPDVAAYQGKLAPAEIAAEFKSCSQRPFVEKMIRQDGDYRGEVARHFTASPYPDFLSSMLYMDFKTHVVHMMNKEDKINMAHGVEGRFPYLDWRVVEFALSLPPKSKLKGEITKHFLKRVAARHFPEDFLNRPKQAFPTPVERWFAEDKSLLRLPHLRECYGDRFDFAYIDSLIAAHSLEDRRHTRRLWGLFTLDLWLGLFFP
ncbi:MAG: asparagine synthase (glutamine-hydrolyzing) [Myxococcales bacterium]|nr:MAG: asparagine synthase (glutamine-hydrolyzing) [Myxococcales bacterium]